MPARFFITASLLLPCIVAHAQKLNADTLFVLQAANEAIVQYKKSLGVQAHVYNGSEYLEYKPQRDEHPYLFEDWNYGTVVYGRVTYDQVPLFYDLVHDELITNYTHGKKIQFLREKVSSFVLEGRKFVMLRNNQIPEGYYELLYDGKMKFYVHRQKVAITTINGNDPEANFEERVKYYLLNDGRYHSIKTKSSLLGHFGDRKKEVGKFLRDNNMKFTPREKSVPAMLVYFEKGV